MINAAETRLLLVGDRYLDLIERMRPRLKVQSFIAIGDGRGGIPRLSDLAAKAEPDETEAQVEAEDTTILMYTSGTPSPPNGVMLSFRGITAYVTEDP